MQFFVTTGSDHSEEGSTHGKACAIPSVPNLSGTGGGQNRCSEVCFCAIS